MRVHGAVCNSHTILRFKRPDGKRENHLQLDTLPVFKRKKNVDFYVHTHTHTREKQESRKPN